MNSPYPGLRSFRQNEADLFFGREEQIEEMLSRLENHRFLAVVGTSGCGKSSLVRAGLIPVLLEGLLSGGDGDWRIAVMRPGDAPFANLTHELIKEDALGPERGNSERAAALLQATLRRGPLGRVEAVRESHLLDCTNILLVVDQFEEIFRYRKQTRNINDADAFIGLLLNSYQPQAGVSIYVVITMRSCTDRWLPRRTTPLM
jgi:energy-coupling factor transporter ATP-binding protein EcfA2